MMNRTPNPYISSFGRPVVTRKVEEDINDYLDARLEVRREMISQMPTRDVESSTILGEEILDIEFEDAFVYDHDGVMCDDMTLARTYEPVV